MADETMATIRSEGSIFWGGKEWKPNKKGIIKLPAAAVEQIEAHHYTPQHQQVGGKLVPSHRVTFERVNDSPEPEDKEEK